VIQHDAAQIATDGSTAICAARNRGHGFPARTQGLFTLAGPAVQAAKVAPFAAGSGGVVRKSADVELHQSPASPTSLGFVQRYLEANFAN
jgi:hypothetical protein